MKENYPKDGFGKDLEKLPNEMIKVDENGNETNREKINEMTDSKRGQWSTGVEFLLSCISMSVGLGNVWRFPYVAYENGGGAFLIPYFLLLFLIGRPIYYLELVLGQFSGRGPIRVWKCVPAFKGVGFAQLFSTAYIAIFYNYLMAISIYYFFASFSSPLPWTDCHSNNVTCPEFYYEKIVLNKSTGLGDLNSISGKLVVCLIISWTLVYLSIVKGITSLGKVAYFTAIFPYTVLITLLLVSLTQEGAIDGIIYFFQPDFYKLLDPVVWYRAVEQSFFSLAVCFGSLVMYSSYNNFNNNVNKDAVIISVLDTFTSLLAGCVIFAVLGTMAHHKGVDIKHVVTQGEGLAFIAYPEGLSKIQFLFPQIWSILFFFMLFTLGIGSSVAMIETILTCIKDEFESLHKHRAKLALVFCILFMLLGLPLTTDAGSYIMILLDNYGVGTAAFLYGIIEVYSIVFIYGLDNFMDDVHFMLKAPPSGFWKFTWGFVTPLVLLVIFVYGNILIIMDHKTKPGIPFWGNILGWMLAAVAICQIPAWMIYTILKQKGCTFQEKASMAFKPANDWGPINKKHYDEWAHFKIDKTFKNVYKSNDGLNTLGMENRFRGRNEKRGSDNFGYSISEEANSFAQVFHEASREDNPNIPKLLSSKKINNEHF